MSFWRDSIEIFCTISKKYSRKTYQLLGQSIAGGAVRINKRRPHARNLLPVKKRALHENSGVAARLLRPWARRATPSKQAAYACCWPLQSPVSRSLQFGMAASTDTLELDSASHQPPIQRQSAVLLRTARTAAPSSWQLMRRALVASLHVIGCSCSSLSASCCPCCWCSGLHPRIISHVMCGSWLPAAS